jgi:platelet-activating factor acetylhydrolase IB subunit alpha
MKTVEAHGHFVQTLAWGRQLLSSRAGGDGANGAEAGSSSSVPENEKLVNVVATGSVDQTIKIWLP